MRQPFAAVLFDLGNTLAAYYHAEQFRPILEAAVRNVLAELQRRGHETIEFATCWRVELQRLELLNAVDVTVFCGDVGWRKPAKIIFDCAAQMLGVRPDRCYFVGDDPKWDVEGAAIAGMRPILIDRDQRHPAYVGARAGNLWDVVRQLEAGNRARLPAECSQRLPEVDRFDSSADVTP